MDDAALVRQVLGGNNEVYGELVQRWAGRVLALCHARVGRADVAEELAQETFVRGLEELSSLADPVRFGPWLAGVALNTCRDWLKSRSNHQGLHGDTPVDAVKPTGEADRPDDLTRVLQAVEALPEESRQVLMLFYYQQATYRELAQILDISPATINARLTRARTLLRSLLGGPGAEGPR